MTNDSFCETVEDNSRDLRPSSSAKPFVKLPTINIKCSHGESENWHIFIDPFECATDKNETLYDIQILNYLKKKTFSKEKLCRR